MMKQINQKYKRYIIVGFARSGTTVTHIALKGHPNVSAVNDEIKMSPLFTQGMATFTASRDSYLTTKEKEQHIPAIFDAITTIQADENTLASGLKIATNSLDDTKKFVECLQSSFKDVVVILNIREDIAAQYSSGMRSRATGQAHSWKTNQLDSKFTIQIPIDKFTNYATTVLRVVEELRKLKDTHQVLEVLYEQDILPNNNEIYYKIFDFLELPKLELSWLNSQKVAPSPEEYILNYLEVKKLLEEIKENQSWKFIDSSVKTSTKIEHPQNNKLNKIKNKVKEIISILQE